MLHTGPSLLVRRLLGLILACALATLGWAQDMGAPGENARLAAFLAAGGAPADLCGGAGHGRPRDHAGCGLCPAGITATLPLAASATAWPLPAGYRATATVRPDLDRNTPRHPAWSGRAPPLA